MAKVVWRIVGYQTGFENGIRGFGVFYMVIGLLGAVGFTVAFAMGDTTVIPGLYSSTSITVHNPIYLALALTSLLSSFFPYAVLAGIAELLRVQKRAAGLQFAGTIKVPTNPIYQSECGECGGQVKAGETTCMKCNQPLEWPPKKKLH